METKIEKKEVVIHDKTNSWFNGKEWIPVQDMTNTHLRRAKLFAQKNEEFHFHKSNEFAAKIEMLEEEAERRKISLKDYNSKFHKNESDYIKRKAERLLKSMQEEEKK